MKLENKTSFPAHMLVGSTGNLEQTGIVACKITYEMRDGALHPLADKMWPVLTSPVDFRGVMLGSEVDFRKPGTDILVFGQAHAAGEKPLQRMAVEIECGPTRYRVDVIGDRQWVKNGRQVKATDPAPFTSMPLTNDRAFGGKAMNNGNQCVHPINPDGRGLCYAAADAPGVILPNLERPDSPIQNWSDNPVPASLFKPLGMLPDHADMFTQLAAQPDPLALEKALAFRGFNATVPGLVVPPGQVGKTLRIAGMDPGGEVVYPLPPASAIVGKSGPVVHVAVGELRSRFPLFITTILAIVPDRLLVVTYLGLFRYLFRPHEIRTAELRWYGDTSVPAIAKVTGAPAKPGQVVGAPAKPPVVELPAPLIEKPLPPPPAPPPPTQVAVVKGTVNEKRILTVLFKRTYKFTHAQLATVADKQIPLSTRNNFASPATPDGPPGSPTDIGEAIAYKSGTDIVVRGHARALEPVTVMNVSVTVGSLLKHQAVVTGKRLIDYVAGRLVFTPPERFTAIPLRYENAYGGNDPVYDAGAFSEMDKHLTPGQLRRVEPLFKELYASQGSGVPPYIYPRNRFGKGYVLVSDPAKAAGRELPNIEFPTDRLTPERVMLRQPRDWVRMPLPAGFDFLDVMTFPRTAMMGMPPFPADELRNVAELATGQIPQDYYRGNMLETPREKIPTLIHPDVGRCAPIGLRAGFLRGDETIALTGMDAKQPEFLLQLPGERPSITIQLHGKPQSPEAQLFQVFVDMDQKILTQVWGATMPLDITLDLNEERKIQESANVQVQSVSAAAAPNQRKGFMGWLGLKE